MSLVYSYLAKLLGTTPEEVRDDKSFQAVLGELQKRTLSDQVTHISSSDSEIVKRDVTEATPTLIGSGANNLLEELSQSIIFAKNAHMNDTQENIVTPSSDKDIELMELNSEIDIEDDMPPSQTSEKDQKTKEILDDLTASIIFSNTLDQQILVYQSIPGGDSIATGLKAMKEKLITKQVKVLSAPEAPPLPIMFPKIPPTIEVGQSLPKNISMRQAEGKPSTPFWQELQDRLAKIRRAPTPPIDIPQSPSAHTPINLVSESFNISLLEKAKVFDDYHNKNQPNSFPFDKRTQEEFIISQAMKGRREDISDSDEDDSSWSLEDDAPPGFLKASKELIQSEEEAESSSRTQTPDMPIYITKDYPSTDDELPFDMSSSPLYSAENSDEDD